MDGAGLANHEPQVLIRGGHLKKLVIYMDMAAPQNGAKTRQEVPLTEVSLPAFPPACIINKLNTNSEPNHSLCHHQL